MVHGYTQAMLHEDKHDSVHAYNHDTAHEQTHAHPLNTCDTLWVPFEANTNTLF